MVHRIRLTNKHLLGLSLVIWSIGFIASMLARDFTWLSRFGALLVGVGVIFFSKHILLTKSYMISVHDVAHCPDQIHKQHKNVRGTHVYGPHMSFFGTITWAFGDLLNQIPGW